MKKINPLLLIVLSIIGLSISILASLAFGARHIGFLEVIQSLLFNQEETLNQIVVHERIPRTVFGIVAGASLGISGALMQAITRNPIADPSILGVNTGASLFVVAGIAFLNIGRPIEYIGLALLGSSLVALFVFGISSLGASGSTPIKLALAGAATSAALSSIISAIVLPRTDSMTNFRFWQVGSISGTTWEGMLTVLPFLLIGLVIGLFSSSTLDALALGDELAIGLGVRTGIVRLLSTGAGVILCGATTAIAGPIGFIGLMVPHSVRLLLGPSMKRLIPMSAVLGAILLLLADVIGRLIGSPSELESGIVTAFIGAPILILIAMKAKVKSL